MRLFNGNGLMMSVHFKNELFQVEERLLVLGSLSHLNHTLPVVFSFDALTLLTYLIDDLKFDDSGLLQQRAAHVFLNRHFDFDSFRMRLGPHEAGIDQV